MARRLFTLLGVSSLVVSGLAVAPASANGPGAETAATYANCLEVWNALGRPITKNDPGYSKKFDRDGDGVGCENPPAGYVKPAPKPTPAPQPIVNTRFVDVPNSRAFATEINWLAAQGISTGWSDRTFRPDLTVERGAMAAFFYRMAGSPSYTAPQHSRFRDVSTSHQFYKEISWMADRGITTGYSDGTFRPDASVTRDAMAAFFYRMSGSPEYSAPATSRFRDIKPGDQFYKEVSWMATRGITTGWADGTFRPTDTVRRDAMAAFIYRYKR